MGEKIASLYAAIGVQGLETVSKDLSGLADGLKKSQKEFSGLTDVTEALAVPMAGAAAGIAAVAGAIAITAGATVEYAGQVDDLGRSLGVSAEEASKLIQVADDAKISYEQLSVASKELIKNGIQPSIENIGKLADEYNAIQDPVQKSQFLLEKFGRAGLQMGKLLEQGSIGIKSAADEAERLGLVMSQGDVAAAEKLRLAWDDLGDSAEGLKIKIGNGLVPTLTDAVDAVNMLAGGFSGGIKQAIEQHAADVALSTVSYQEYETELERVARDNNYLIDTEGNLVAVRRDGQRVTTEVIQANYVLTESERELTKARDLATLAGDRATAGYGNFLASADAIEAGKQRIAEADQAAADAAQELADNQEEARQAFARTLDDAAAIEQGIGGQIAGALEQAGLKSGTLLTALGLVDAEFGTGSKRAEEMQIAIGKAVDQFKRDKDVDTFKAALEKINLEFGTTFERASAAAGAIQLIYDNLGKLPDRKAIDIVLTYGTNTQEQDAARVANGNKRAGGGPVQRGRGYMVGEQGPEWFQPEQNGRIIPADKTKEMGKGGGSPIFNIYANSELDLEMAARRIAAIIGAS